MARALDPTHTLAARFPTLAAQWHPERNPSGPGHYTPEVLPSSSPATVWWRCTDGHEWEDKVAIRTGMPKWKNGDVAACPECVNSPTRLVTHTYPGCGHILTVQRKNAENGQQNCPDCGSDPDPAQDAARREHRRAAALASYRRRKERGRSLTDEERAAQRALVGFLNGAPVEAFRGGLIWWRDKAMEGIHQTTTTERLSTWLTILAIAHLITIKHPGPSMRVPQSGVYVHSSELSELEKWAPTFARRVRRSSVFSTTQQ